MVVGLTVISASLIYEYTVLFEPSLYTTVKGELPPVMVTLIAELEPLQMQEGPDKARTEEVGFAFTVTDDVVLLQPVVVAVKVKVALPAVKPITNPASVTDATNGLLLTHAPPVVGNSCDVLLIQIDELPVIFTVGGVISCVIVMLSVFVQPLSGSVIVTEYVLGIVTSMAAIVAPVDQR